MIQVTNIYNLLLLAYINTQKAINNKNIQAQKHKNTYIYF
jgi:hypothetical protein